MKNNGSNQKCGEYYLGLDIGTNSVGWAVTDTDYNLMRFKGEDMWGARLFDEANSAAGRRKARTARRRLERRKQRLQLLKLIFCDEIYKKDPLFFDRLSESGLHYDDKKLAGTKYSLFADADYTDADYRREYPTAYHLRRELIRSHEKHDVRLVYLAIHHILKSRGHFLYSGGLDSDEADSGILFGRLKDYISENFDTEITADAEKVMDIMSDSGISRSEKQKRLNGCIRICGERDGFNKYFTKLLSGLKVEACKIFDDDEIDKAIKIELDKTDDETLAKLEEALGERIQFITLASDFYNCARLHELLGGADYISCAKADAYDDLPRLKKYVKEHEPEKYAMIFCAQKEKTYNYADYMGRKPHGVHAEKTKKEKDENCHEKFCKFITETLPDMKDDPEYGDLYKKAEAETLLPRLRGSDNCVIPYQLHEKELKAILKNASEYLDFLNEKDEDGLSASDKILKLLDFRIPYYVGPLNKKSPRSWFARTIGHETEKIYPWNFDRVVDRAQSAENFITRMSGLCPYTGETVLARDSLLYSEYCLLNELNPLNINGKPLPPDIKADMIEELFVKKNQRVTKKTIKDFLLCRGLITQEDEIYGVDDMIKSKLRSYHDFKKILEKTDRKKVDEIIDKITVFGDDKKMLDGWLKENCDFLDENDRKYVCRLNYKDRGRYSRKLLEDIYFSDKTTGETRSVIETMRSTNDTLRQLLTDKYDLDEKLKEYREKTFGGAQSAEEIMDEMYIPPKTKRSVRQTLKIVDEIVDIQKCVPKKIFIETERDAFGRDKGKRTVSRKDSLIELYKKCGADKDEEYSELFARLEKTDESALRQNTLYFYYTQFGKCMYTWEDIELDRLGDSQYCDKDHIYPRSRVKDDSLDNLVLVLKKVNLDKSNVYPIDGKIREKMSRNWLMLLQKGMISKEKYKRLTRTEPLTEKELTDFVARQLVDTQQSTKAAAVILGRIYGDAKPRIVYSKAGNVSEFRQKFNIVKCRDVNDLHHAKDAYLNIVVGNVYDTKFTANFFKNIMYDNDYSVRTDTLFSRNVAGAWDAAHDPGRIKRTVARDSVKITRMPHETTGIIAKLNILPKGEGQLPVKEGKDIAKYGGYDKVQGAYFFVVEHRVKKKTERTIEPVYIYKKELYEKDPIKYCTDILGLCEPKIICGKIFTDSLLQLNGNRYYITGRTGVQIIVNHDCQLCVGEKNEKYIKDVKKYWERSGQGKKEPTVNEKDGVSRDGNMQLYDLFIDKASSAPYKNILPSTVLPTLQKARDGKFPELSLPEQCGVLLEILKFFECKSGASNLKNLDGSATMGILLLSKKLSNFTSAYCIHRSVTGLYEKKVNLLK